MSEAVVKVEAPEEVEIIRGALATRSDAGSTQLVAEVDELYFMRPEEQAQVADIHEKRRILQWNGKKGHFKDLESGETSETRTGAVLEKLDPSQAWFPADAERADWPDDQYICRSDSVSLPPKLNPRLTPEQANEARRRGAGHDCRTCPLAQWNGDDPPECGSQFRVLWFDGQLGTEVELQAGGKSISPLRNYVADLKKPVTVKLPGGKTKKVSLSLYARATVFGHGEYKQEGKKEWYQVAPRACSLVPPSVFEQLREVRDMAMQQLEQQKVAAGSPTAEPAPTSAPSQPATSAPAAAPAPAVNAPPAAPVSGGGGVRLTPDGAVHLPGGKPAAATPQPEPAWDEIEIDPDEVPF